MKKRNESLDVMRAIAAVLVCFQHSVEDHGFSGYLLMVSRVAVPLFIMLSGYFYSDIVEKKKEKVQILQFVKIAFGMFLLYFFCDFTKQIIKGQAIEYLAQSYTIKNIMNFIIFNDPIHADHAWYMWSMVYTLLIMYFFPNIYKSKFTRRIVIIIGLLLQIVFGKYSIALLGVDISSTFTRNVWCVALPYFLIGYEIKILIKKTEIKSNITIFFAIISTLACIIERYLLCYFDVNATRESYIFLAFMSVSYFMIFLNIKKINFTHFLADYGKRYSLMLYIIHPLFVRIERKIFDMQSPMQYLGFMFVLIISSLCSVLIVNLRRAYLIKRKS